MIKEILQFPGFGIGLFMSITIAAFLVIDGVHKGKVNEGALYIMLFIVIGLLVLAIIA